MTAITRNARFRAWRFAVAQGDVVGIERVGAGASTGLVTASRRASVDVRDAHSGHVYRFRRNSGNAVNQCTVFMVPPENARS